MVGPCLILLNFLILRDHLDIIFILTGILRKSQWRWANPGRHWSWVNHEPEWWFIVVFQKQNVLSILFFGFLDFLVGFPRKRKHLTSARCWSVSVLNQFLKPSYSLMLFKRFSTSEFVTHSATLVIVFNGVNGFQKTTRCQETGFRWRTKFLKVVSKVLLKMLSWFRNRINAQKEMVISSRPPQRTKTALQILANLDRNHISHGLRVGICLFLLSKSTTVTCQLPHLNKVKNVSARPNSEIYEIGLRNSTDPKLPSPPALQVKSFFSWA